VRQGISLPPSIEAGKGKDPERVLYLPDILVREVMWVMVSLLAILVAVTTFFSAPLEDHANPFMTPLHSTAPWYFLWLQGLIKLPDVFGGLVEGKFVYGVVVPGIFFGILFALPYIDRNPSRRWQDRKLVLGLGALVIVALVVLTWMGTPAYKVQAPPAEEIALELVPFDRHGRIHEVPWDELIDGSYDTATFSENTIKVEDPNYPGLRYVKQPEQLKRFMFELQEAMRAEREHLPNGVATLTIATWQRDLKRVDLNIVWEVGGEEHTFSQYTYIHKDAIH